jgi:hypothetical protein
MLSASVFPITAMSAITRDYGDSSGHTYLSHAEPHLPRDTDGRV